jgi:hypothetical protein
MKFVNDGTWAYIGSIKNEKVFVKRNSCIYVDTNGEIIPSPEDRKDKLIADERLRHLKGT